MSGGCGWTAPLYRSMFPSVLIHILECAPVKSEPVRLFDGGYYMSLPEHGFLWRAASSIAFQIGNQHFAHECRVCHSTP